MRVEIDQSGKIGDTKVPTALAFSNKKQFVILIPAAVKRKCIQELRKKGKSGTTLYVQLFTVGLYLLLQHRVRGINQIIIDIEYPGHEAKIKEHLINIMNRAGVSIEAEVIQFGYVGKESNAHKQAILTFAGKSKANKIIQLDELLREFRK